MCAELTKPLQLLHRYECAAFSRFMWAMRELKQGRRSREDGGELPSPKRMASPSQPTPAPRPAPQPEPAPAPAEPRLALPARMSAVATPGSFPTVSSSPQGPGASDPITVAADFSMNRHQRRAAAARARQAAR